MSSSNQTLNNYLSRYAGKLVKILTKSNLHYETQSLKPISKTAVVFVDKFGVEIMLANSEIVQVTEVRDGN